ncbi:MAG TPA: hypothetical protein VFP59_19055 [Candidatus Angelobacter sp.]|nr:hypothetical protein [Candidatus Angelobacter sp.]
MHEEAIRSTLHPGNWWRFGRGSASTSVDHANDNDQNHQNHKNQKEEHEEDASQDSQEEQESSGCRHFEVISWKLFRFRGPGEGRFLFSVFMAAYETLCRRRAVDPFS